MSKKGFDKIAYSNDKSLLDVINSSYLTLDDVKWLKSKRWFKRFLKIYSKELKKRYDASPVIDKKIEPKDEDIEILDFTKTISIPSHEVIEILDFTRTINISDTKDIINATSKAKRKVKIEKAIWRIIILICIVLLAIMLFILGNSFMENKKTKDMISKVYDAAGIKEITPKTTNKEDSALITTTSSIYEKYGNMNMIEVNFDDLKNINPDTAGWIKVEGTKINYPFVKASDNEYYLKHSFDKSSNKKGWVFLDYRNDINNIGKNTILYAHGLVNNEMFGSLRRVVKSNWYKNKNNYVLSVVTPHETLKWLVFSTYTIEPESYYITTNFESNEEFDEFVNLIKQRSVYDYGVDVTSSDKLLTVSSCYDDKKRMVLHSKLIR